MTQERQNQQYYPSHPRAYIAISRITINNEPISDAVEGKYEVHAVSHGHEMINERCKQHRSETRKWDGKKRQSMTQTAISFPLGGPEDTA